ncbi:MAG: amidohydrolase family protein [Gammaproteobacteria bacterium]|nr:amidohydrolase family protein [Gammaproteobacteria bacterium]
MSKAAIAFTLAMLVTTASAAATKPVADPYPSTYQRIPSAAVLIRNATVLTGTGERLEGSDVVMDQGRIVAVGQGLQAPQGAQVIDGTGKWVTPGIIDVHSHLGVYSSPGVSAHEDGNEMSSPVTPNVWAEHAIWPQDPGFGTALAGGVTSMQILPGSGNLIGGRGVTVKNVSAVTYQAMKFPGAPWGLKMACGENPKRVYGSKGGSPMTRMGNVAGYRTAFIEAQAYMRSWDKYLAGQKSDEAPKKKSRWGKQDDESDAKAEDPPARDLAKDTLMAAMKGDIRVHIHCYRADEMAIMLDLAKEFGFKVAAFHHGVEAYKLADRLAAEGVCGALWADWWGFKMEALDGVEENVALVDRPANGCAIVHSDSSEGIQRLNQEAAKMMAHGRAAGMDIRPERAIRWLTANPAKALGIDGQTGSLEAGKMADVVIWNGTPFSVYAHAEKVFVDGALLYDRADKSRQPRSDFMLGLGVSP